MNIIFEPAHRTFQINKNKWKSNGYNNVDYYKIYVENEQDIKTLESLKKKSENTKIEHVNRNGNVYILEYDDITNKIKKSFDFEFVHYELNVSCDINLVCIDIYKKYIEKSILTRANKMPSSNYLYDFYILLNDKECENISYKFNEIFSNLLDCANIRIHFMNIELKEVNYLYDYTKSCSIC